MQSRSSSVSSRVSRERCRCPCLELLGELFQEEGRERGRASRVRLRRSNSTCPSTGEAVRLTISRRHRRFASRTWRPASSSNEARCRVDLLGGSGQCSVVQHPPCGGPRHPGRGHHLIEDPALVVFRCTPVRVRSLFVTCRLAAIGIWPSTSGKPSRKRGSRATGGTAPPLTLEQAKARRKLANSAQISILFISLKGDGPICPQ